ncbi:MAG: putative thymidylate synthase [Candidatus Woesearchaeota archaeon]|nr:putative thymidylate synthase [Candidatus Woesearchaeota archaeon]
MEIKLNTTVQAWHASLKYVLENGTDFKDYKDNICREVINLLSVIDNPKKDVTRPITVLRGFQKWIYPPLDELHNIVLRKKSSPGHSYLYGPRIFNYQGLNQIDDFLIPLLKNDSYSRRGIIILWNPTVDAKQENKMVPGWVSMDFKLRHNKLNVTSHIRSNDLWFGWPASLYQAFSLQEYAAKKLGCNIGFLATLSGSAHIFKYQFPYIRKVLKN